MPIINLVYEAPEGWKPGANTLLYMPLNSTNTKNDTYGGHTTTQGGTVRYGTYGGVDCADFTSKGNINITPFALPQKYTILVWANNISGAYDSSYGGRILDLGNPRLGIAYIPGQGYYTYENNGYFNVTTQNKWYLIAVTVNGSTGIGYIMGDGVSNTTSLTSTPNQTTPSYINIGNEYNNGANRYFLGYMSELILESKEWSASEISDYYNQTKGNYEAPEPTKYIISNIPTDDSNVYVNIIQSGKTIQSVKFNLTCSYIQNRSAYVFISSNASNTNRYGFTFRGDTTTVDGYTGSGIYIRGRLNNSSNESVFRKIPNGFSTSSPNVIEYTINKDGNCSLTCNGQTTSFTATSSELTMLQTIMNSSTMNVYSSQSGSIISGNKVDVTVTYS